MKNKLRIKLFIIISLFMLTFISINTSVNATLWFMGFEGGTVGQQYGDSNFYTSLDYNEGLGYQVAYVYDNLPFYGTRDYYIYFEDYYYSRPNICTFHYNYTTVSSMTYFKMYIRQYASCNGEWTYYHFRNNASQEVINIRLGLSNPLSYYQYQDFDGIWIQAGIFYTLSGYDYVGWQILSNDTVTYFTNLNETTDTPRNVLTDMRVTNTKIDSQEESSLYKFLIDNINYETGTISGIPTNETEMGLYTINLRLHNIVTGNILYWKGKNVSGGQYSVMGSKDYTDCYLILEDFPTGYGNNNYCLTETFPITFNFTEGSIIDFSFTNSMALTDFLCNIGVNDIFFKGMTYQLEVHSGSIYDIYLQPTIYIDGVDYNYCGGNDITNGYVSVCLNKKEYAFGESARLQYYLPTGNWLISNGWLTHGWYFAFFDTSEYFYGSRLNKWDYINRLEITPEQFDGNRHTSDFEITTYNWHGYEQYYQKYECCILNYENGWFDKELMFDRMFFYSTGSDFSPNGSIISVSPSPAYSGQAVTISFLSNGIGRLEINYPSGEKMFSQAYLYSNAIHNITKTIIGNGIYSIELYTYSAVTNTTDLVAHQFLTVSVLGENGTYGSYGYGVPYLYIPQYRVIAGYDTISIFYRTYRNNSRLNITSPRGELTFFSTTVSNESDNVLTIESQSYMQIGTWNVSLEGGDIYGNLETLNTSFNVITEENSWIEFSKHTFYDNEPFGLFIKHGSYRVSLTFYKNDIAQGESILFNVGEPEESTIYSVPFNKVTPSIGYWRVEMWRINDRNIIYELAEWNCYVISSPYIAPITGEFSFATIPVLFKILISIVIILVTTLSPLAFGIFLTKKTHITELKIPHLLYVGFFMFGMSICVGMGIMDIAYIFAVLFVIAMISIIVWVKEKQGAE